MNHSVGDGHVPIKKRECRWSMLRGPLSLCILILMTACSRPQRADPQESSPDPETQALHPDLTKLRLYRTYYHVQLESPTAHQFEVWYQYGDGEEEFREWEVFHVAASDSDDTSRIKESDYLPTYVAYLGFKAPREGYTRVPPQLKRLEDGIRKAVSRNHADLGVKRVEVHYHGLAARVIAYELIPIGGRGAIRGFRFSFADFRKGTYREYGASSNGFGSLGLENYWGPCVKDPIWVDFVLPEAIEGSSLFSVEYYPEIGPLYRKTEKALMKRILATARTIERGEAFDSSIERILMKQGDTLLPFGIRQYLELEVSIYGRTANFDEQLDRKIKFLIPASDKPFRFEKEDPETDIKCVVTGNIQERRIEVEVVGPDGTTRKTALVSNSTKFGLIKDGPRTACKDVLYMKSDQRGMTLPGRGKYYQFDVHPDSTLHPSRFTGARK